MRPHSTATAAAAIAPLLGALGSALTASSPALLLGQQGSLGVLLALTVGLAV